MYFCVFLIKSICIQEVIHEHTQLKKRFFAPVAEKELRYIFAFFLQYDISWTESKTGREGRLGGRNVQQTGTEIPDARSTVALHSCTAYENIDAANQSIFKYEIIRY